MPVISFPHADNKGMSYLRRATVLMAAVALAAVSFPSPASAMPAPPDSPNSGLRASTISMPKAKSAPAPETVKTGTWVKCSRIVNTQTGAFTCSKPRRETVTFKYTTADKPAYVKSSDGKWKAVPYSWSKKRQALVFTPGLVPLANAIAKAGMSSPYMLVMRECRSGSPACSSMRETVVTARVKSNGRVWNTTGKKSLNAVWKTGISKAVSNKALLPLPSQPLDVKAAVDVKGNVKLTWTAPTVGAPFTGYTVTSSPDDAKIVVDGLAADASNLTPGKEYVFTVTALNRDGTGTPATVVVTPTRSPQSKTVISVSPKHKALDVSWGKITTDGGLPVTDYSVMMSGDEGKTWSVLNDGVSTSTSMTIDSLTNGHNYYVTVAAVNSLGIGEYAAPAAGSPYTNPSAPSALTATPGNYSMTLKWNAPSDDGGRAVKGYNVYISKDGTTWGKYSGENSGYLAGSTDTNVVVTGLTNGDPYYFAVKSINAAGESGLSESVKATPRTVPDAPTLTSAVAGDTTVDVAWDAPAWDGGNPVSGYTVRTTVPLTEAQSNETVPDITDITGTNVQVPDLANGTEYTFTVYAVNEAGESVASASLTATPFTVPDAPLNVLVGEDNTVLNLSWTPGFNGGRPVTSSIVTITPAEGEIAYTGDTTAQVTGLRNGVEYTVSVASVNIAGTGPDSATAVGTPRTVPDAPVNVNAVEDNATVLLSWDAPAWDGGSPITGYTVNLGDAGTTAADVLINVDPIARTAAVTGLANGKAYSFAVTADNEAGSSVNSATLSATPRTVPDAPLNLAAVEDNTLVSLSWDAPAWDGGSPITGYAVNVNPEAGGTVSIVGSTAEITGLANGTEYTFTVTAVNEAGAGLGTGTQATPRTVPDAPTDTAITEGDTVLDVSWTAPAWNGGSPITSYTVAVSPNEGVVLYTGELSAHLSGLANGTEYTVTVTATNEAGAGAGSVSALGTPRTVPDAPTGTAATSGNTFIDLDWDAPAWNGGSGITEYAVAVSPVAALGSTHVADNPVVTVVYNGSSARVSGLENGAEYAFTVTAVNEAGTGPATSPVNAIPYTVPDPVTALVATPDDTSVALDWDAPLWNGGNAIQGYHVTVSPAAGTVTLDGTSASVTGLANGTMYTFTVTAFNAAGDSSNVTANAKPRTFPDAPTGLTATPGDTKVDLSWTAPLWNGGADIAGYDVWFRAQGSNTWVLFHRGASVSTSYAVTGLVNGTEYEFGVSAFNEAGVSARTAPVNSTPRNVPDAPTGLTATPDAEKVHLEWTTPGWNGGSPITGYTVYIMPAGGVVSYNGTTADITGLAANTTYTFTVVAVNAAGESAQSGSADALTPPALPASIMDNQSCTDTACTLSYGLAPGAVKYLIYRNGVLLDTVDGSTSSYTDNGPLTPETLYTYDVVPVNIEDVAGLPTRIVVATIPNQPVLISGPAYYASTDSVVVKVNVPNPEAGVTYAATATPDGGVSIADTGIAGTVTCNASECTATWTGWASHLGTKYIFTITPSNFSGQGPKLDSSAAAPSTSDLSVSVYNSYDYCPGGYPTDLGNGNCRTTLSYTYHTESYTIPGGSYQTWEEVQHTSGTAPAHWNGSAWVEDPCPGGQWNGGDGNCYYRTWEWVTHSYGPSTGYRSALDATPAGYSDSGSYWYKDTVKVVYNTYRGVTGYAWSDANLISHNVGVMYVNGSLASNGVSSELDRCVGTVTFDMRGIGGSSIASASGICN